MGDVWSKINKEKPNKIDKIVKLLKKRGVDIDPWDIYLVEEDEKGYELSVDGKIYISKMGGE